MDENKKYNYLELEKEIQSFSNDEKVLKDIDISDAFINDYSKTIDLLQELCVKISTNSLATQNEIDSINRDSAPAAFLTYRFLNPFVGALLVRVKEKKVTLNACYRGAVDGDNHAEFTLLEIICKDKTITCSDILFTTLEPCIKESRNPWRESCSDLIVKRGIKNVYIGTLDPNPIITGKGVDFLLKNGIDIRFFSEKNRKMINQNNKFFLEQFKIGNPKVYKDIFDTLVNYLNFNSMEKYIAFDENIIDNAADFKLKYESLPIESKYSYIFSFFKKMTLNRSILSARNEVDKYTCIDDFALFFFDKPKNIVDGATIFLTEPGTGSTLIDESLYEAVDKIEKRLTKYYGVNIPHKPENEALSKIKVIEKFLFKEVDEDDSILREVILNALIHRDYHSPIFTKIELSEDSIVITNPVSKETNDEIVERMNKFSHRSNPTNSRLMRYFMDIRFCERNSNGMKIAKRYQNYISFTLDENVLETKLSIPGNK